MQYFDQERPSPIRRSGRSVSDLRMGIGIEVSKGEGGGRQRYPLIRVERTTMRDSYSPLS
jgi:hypothetical protein